MPALITTLIDKEDNAEIVRDQIAAILVTEIANQQLLATAAGKDPRLFDLRIFTERSNPWSEWQDAPADELDVPPIVNVSFQNSNADRSASNSVKRQAITATYNLDCLAYGISRATAGGHQAGDEMAAIDALRGIRLVRNILMSGQYTYLDMRGVVWTRWVANITAFQPEFEDRAVQNVQAVRMAFEVKMNEFSPQVIGQGIETIGVTVKRAETGEIYIKARYDADGVHLPPALAMSSILDEKLEALYDSSEGVELDDSKVGQWTNLAPLTIGIHDLVQDLVDRRPVVGSGTGPNGKDRLEYDGVDDFLSVNDFSLAEGSRPALYIVGNTEDIDPAEFKYIAVMDSGAVNVTRLTTGVFKFWLGAARMNNNPDADSSLFNSDPLTTSPVLLENLYRLTGHTFAEDGSETVDAAATAGAGTDAGGPITKLTLGAFSDGTGALNCNIWFAMVLNAEPTDQQIADIRSWIAIEEDRVIG